MRLRNLFMILLLCMTVGVFSACTGDDGATGPQGPPGPAGPAGEPGDDGEDAGSTESNYPFLTTWGDEDGRLACDDPLLTEEGVFPGPASLTALGAATNAVRYAATNNDADTANGYVAIGCASTIFDAVENPNLDGNEGGDLMGAAATSTNVTNADATPQTAALIFVKTARGGDAAPVTQPGARAAVANGRAGEVRTVQKTFTEGKFFANMDVTRVAGEVADRRDLYRDCDKGTATAPPALAGEWRAVHIDDRHRNTQINDNGFEVAAANTEVVRTTRKVCIRLDSLPGAVKCYVREEVTLPGTVEPGSVASGVTASQTEKIIIYGDGTDSMVVAPKAAAATAAAAIAGRLGPNDTTAAVSVQFIGDANDFRGAKLCNLFSEAAQANTP